MQSDSHSKDAIVDQVTRVGEIGWLG